MKSDITSRKDIKLIISKFYHHLIEDEKMFPFFKSFVENNTLEHHLKIITDFWEDILFDTNNYNSNTLQKHLDFNTKIKFSKTHFNVWTSYFFKTIDDYFSGQIAENMKNKARSIATVLELKMKLY